MKPLEITEENLPKIEESILVTSEKEFDTIYDDDDYLYKLMEVTKNKRVFIKCMQFISIPFLEKKVKDADTSKEMIFKLSLHPNHFIQYAILSRNDITPDLLRQMLENYKHKKTLSIRNSIINHKAMNEQTLYDLCDYDNDDLLAFIILSNNVSNRILKKLQNNENEEIKTMALVRDPQTDFKYIKRILKREFKNLIMVEERYLGKVPREIKAFPMTDILEAGIKNPSLPTELVELYKYSTKPALISMIIPHPNISDELLDYYYKIGDEDIKEAVSKRRGEKQEYIK